MVYSAFNIPFDIHTEASDTQLGVVISQCSIPIAFYSCKSNNAHTRYTPMEKDLLSIIETLKEIKNILLGHQIKVYTNHKNLTYKIIRPNRLYSGK